MADQNSTQYANTVAHPPVANQVNEWKGKLRLYRFTVTTSAAVAGDDFALVQLPAGLVRMVLPLSRVFHSGFGASRTLDLGWEAYTKTDGTAVAADPNGLDDGVDISSSGNFNPGGTVGQDETYLFDSQGGVVVTAQVNDGSSSAGLTISGYFVAVHD